MAWGAAFMFGGFKFLPLDCASALGGALVRRIGPFLGVSKHARRNISRAFPELSETEIARVVAGMWDNLGRLAAEYPHLRKICVFEPGGRVETDGFEHVDRSMPSGWNAVGFCGHHRLTASSRSVRRNWPICSTELIGGTRFARGAQRLPAERLRRIDSPIG